MNYIIVPEGIAVDKHGNPLPEPSFVYRQVLDYVADITHNGDTIYLAPANNYGGEHYEQELAHTYLSKKIDAHIHCPVINSKTYIDTHGNAKYLKDFLSGKIKSMTFDLVCAYIHSYRAHYCFKKVGFNVEKIHRVYYAVDDNYIVSRLWYYKYKPIHYGYELLAFMRDVL
jgi:hypothetical protein